MNRKSLAAAIASTTLALFAGAALADTSADDIAPELKAAKPSSLSRAEVQADLVLWRRAGLPAAYGENTVDSSSADYQARFAEYQRLRQGPAFLAELRRIQGAQPVSAQVKSGQPG